MTEKVFKKEHIGVEVYSSEYGRGKIIDYKEESNTPVVVGFVNGSKINYMSDGKLLPNQKITLSFHEYYLPDNWYVSPLPDIPVNTLVFVWNNDKKQKVVRCFSHFTRFGEAVVFKEGRTYYDYALESTFKHWELACKEIENEF